MIYHNEIEPYPAQWLRNLFPGHHVDERSIHDVRGTDVEGFKRCHFFSGIGGWEYALSLAGWPEYAPVWTGSCPCQPISQTGKKQKEKDPRHLWPEFRRIIAECRPATIFGEQVASPGGREWLSGVRADLEALGYAVGAADLCAAGASAPHIRQRLYWVADATGFRFGQGEQHRAVHQRDQSWRSGIGNGCDALRVGDSGSTGLEKRIGNGRFQRQTECAPEGEAAELSSDVDGMGDSESDRRRQKCPDTRGSPEGIPTQIREQRPWDNFDVIAMLDGKTRRFERGSFPLAPRVPSTMGRLRAYGNAIVPQVAAMFIRAFMETKGLEQHTTSLPATEPGKG